MSVLGRLSLGSAERLDLPDILSESGYVAADFEAIIKTFVGSDKSYILSGFEVVSPSLAIGAETLAISIADAAVYYPQSNAGSFYYGFPEGNDFAQPLVPELRKNATNFVYLTFSTFDTAKDTRAFWDVDQNGGEGGEFTQDVNTETVLSVQVNVSVASFPEGTVPLCKVVVGASVIQSIQDCRPMMWRLGTGGLLPDPFATYDWKNLPSAPYARNEPSSTITSAAQPNPFQGGDKNITTLKEWMDAVMTRIKEIGGTTYWYEAGGSASPTPPNINDLFQDFAGTAFDSKGRWEHSGATPGLVTYTEDMNIRSLRDPREAIIRADNFTVPDNNVAWIDIVRDADLSAVPQTVSWTNGVNFVNGSAGAFSDVKQGDWIKSKNDDVDKYVRAEQFYALPNLAGGTTTPALAQSVRLSAVYAGSTTTEFGERYQGEYLVSDINITTHDDASVQTAGGNFYWIAYREDTKVGITNLVPTTLTLTIDQADGTKARCTSGAVHGLQNYDRVYIASGVFAGTYQVEVESTTVFYITTAITGTDSGVAAYYAIVTTQAVDNGYGFELENADHGCRNDEHIVIDAASAYDGNYQVSVRSATSVQIAVTLNSGTYNGTTNNAFFAVPKVSVRTELGPVNLVQGEEINIGDLDTENIMSFIGMESLAQTKPNYHLPQPYNTLDGEENFNSDENDDLTVRASRLTAMMADRVQERGFIMASVSTIINNKFGINQEISATTNIILKKPKSPDQTINLSGAISMPVNSMLIANIDRNSSATITPTVESVASTTLLGENKLILAVRYSTDDIWWMDGTRIPSNGRYTISNPEDAQLKNIEVYINGSLKFAPGSGLVTFDMTRVKETTKIITVAGASVPTGSYFILANANDAIKYYFWYKINGVGIDPAVSGRTGILVNILNTDTAAQVATKTAAALPGASFTSSILTNVLTITNVGYGPSEDAANGSPSPTFNISILAQGVDAVPEIVIPGSANNNTIDTTTINGLGTLIIPADYCAWVRIDRTAAKIFDGVETNLNIQDSNINGRIYVTSRTTVPTNQDTFVLFTRVDDNLIRHHEAGRPDANVYDEQITVISSVPANPYELQGPTLSGIIINLPPDTRDGNSPQTYVVGAGQLEVYLNGQYLRLGTDWSEIGQVDVESGSITMLQSLVVGDVLFLRIDANAGVYFASAGGGGTAAPLQDSYNTGRFINTNSGQPIVISGPSGEKLMVIQGDLDVTGIIDPIALQLNPVAANPMSAGDKGIWVDNNNDLRYENGSSSINISDDFLRRDGATQFTATQDANGFTVTNLSTPSAASDAATKGYADTTFVRKDGTSLFTGDINFNGNKGINVATPTIATDAVNKNYVDANFYHLDGSLPLAADMSAGGNQISNLGTPLSPNDAATKTYVDTTATLFLKKDGSVVATGDLNLGGHKLTNVVDPTSAQDAATKAYVDNIATTIGTYATWTNADSITLNPGDIVIAGTTPQTVLRADADVYTTAQSIVGIVDQTITVGNSGKIQITGERTVTTSLTLVPGYPAYLSQTPGTVTPVAPTDSGSAVMMVGVATATNKILLNAQYRFRNEPSYEEPYPVAAPISSGTNLTLPLNSRNGSVQEYYVVGKGHLQLFLNGQKLKLGTDWSEVGAPAADSSTIQILDDLVIGDILIFRDAVNTEFMIGGGGGGPYALGQLTDVVVPAPVDGDILAWDNTLSYWKNIPNNAGVVNTAANVGVGTGQVFKNTVADTINMRTLEAGNEISIVTGTNSITIARITAAPYYREDIVPNAGTLTILLSNPYVMGTDTLEMYRNGVRLMNQQPENSSSIDKFAERSRKAVTVFEGLSGSGIPDGFDVFSAVNQDVEPDWCIVVTNQTGTTLTVPSYTVGDDGLRVFRNGVLMNSTGLGNPIDKYTETSSTLITLNQVATSGEHFLISYGPVPSNRTDIDGLTGTFISSVPTYNMGTDELLVYRNGILMFNSTSLGIPVDRYQETSATSITLASAALASDVFTFIVK